MTYNFLSPPNRFKPRQFKELSGSYSHTRFKGHFPLGHQLAESGRQKTKKKYHSARKIPSSGKQPLPQCLTELERQTDSVIS